MTFRSHRIIKCIVVLAWLITIGMVLNIRWTLGLVMKQVQRIESLSPLYTNISPLKLKETSTVYKFPPITKTFEQSSGQMVISGERSRNIRALLKQLRHTSGSKREKLENEILKLIFGTNVKTPPKADSNPTEKQRGRH